MKAELTVTATGKPGDTITLTGKNFTSGGNIPLYSSVLFGGIALTTNQDVTDLSAAKAHADKDDDGADDDFSVKVLIPSNAVSGVNQIKVTDAASVSATATIDVTARSITIDPDTGPPGTTFTIVGSGFPESRVAVATSVSNLKDPGGTEYTAKSKTGLFTTGSGTLPGSDQLTIPSDAPTSVITVTVSIMGADSVLATATDKFTVTGRVLTVVPTSGPRGTKVLITGTKFTASMKVLADTVTVDGKSTTHSVANLTSAGDVPGISLNIPKDAGIGSKTISLSDNGSTVLTGTTKFTVTVPTLVVGLDSAHMGQAVPITGAGWVPDSAVTLTLTSASTERATKVVTADGAGGIDTSMVVPSTVGVGPVTVTFTAEDQATYNNDSTAQTMKIPKPTVTLSVSEANIGDVVDVTAAGFAPSSGLRSSASVAPMSGAAW
jgi:hypothetical protein